MTLQIAMNQHMIQTHIPQIFNYKAKSLACLGSTNVENWDAVLSVLIFWAKYSFTLVYIYYFIYIYIYIYIYPQWIHECLHSNI